MFKHILLPVDGSSTSLMALEKAVGLARAFQSSVSVIYVIDPYAFSGVGADFSYGQAQYLAAATTEAKQALSVATQALEAAGLAATASVIESHTIYRGILETAQSLDVDLIFMGSHGRRGLEKLVLGSVAAQVLAHAHLPILIVRD
jgi:nucleotide-binding universal stress UspA family protein